MRPTIPLLPLLALLPCLACYGAVEPSSTIPYVHDDREEPRCGADVGVALELEAPQAMETREDGAIVIAHGSASAVAAVAIARWGDDRLLHVVAEHPQTAPVVALSARGDAFTTADGKVWALPGDGPPVLLAAGRARVRAVAISATRAYWSESGPDGSILVGMGVPGGTPEPLATLPGPEAARGLWIGGTSLLYAIDLGPRTRFGSVSIPIGGLREQVLYEGLVTSDILGGSLSVTFGTTAGITTMTAPPDPSGQVAIETVATENPVVEQAGGVYHDAPSLQLRRVTPDGSRVRAYGVSGVTNLRASRRCALWLDRAGGSAGTGAVLAVSL